MEMFKNRSVGLYSLHFKTRNFGMPFFRNASLKFAAVGMAPAKRDKLYRKNFA